MVTGPSSASVRATIASTAAESATSAASAIAPPPAAALGAPSAWAASACTAWFTHPAAPRCARSRAVARPMPRAPPVTTATWLRHSMMFRIRSRCALVRLVDQPNDSRAIVHADRWSFASLPAIERIAQCGKSGRGDVGAGEGLVALGGGELHDPVLHCENGVAAGDLPLTVSAVTREAVADLDGTEDAARRAEHN